MIATTRLWRQSMSRSPPPVWITSLRSQAKALEKQISFDIKVFDEVAWSRRAFTFDDLKFWEPNSMSTVLRSKLTLGDERKEYTLVGEAFAFADKEDNPVVNSPMHVTRLWWEHTSPTEKLLIQLGPSFPPLLWLSVKPTTDALRKCFAEFLDVDAQHMKENLPYFEGVQNRIETRANERLAVKEADVAGMAVSSSLREAFIADIRTRDPSSLLFDWPHRWNGFIGTVDSFRLTEDHFLKHNPFVFGWPLLLSEGNTFMEGSPVKASAFRTIFSKSLLMLHSRLDLQVDTNLAKIREDDEPDVMLDVPVFASVSYPKNQRLCGGSALVQRYNAVMNTSYPLDMPVDVIAALSASKDAIRGTKELRAEIDFMLLAMEKLTTDVERTIRLDPRFSSVNRVVGNLAYAIAYLAILEDPRWKEDVFDRFKGHSHEMIRMACAKGAAALKEPSLVAELLHREPEGRGRELLQMIHNEASATPNANA